MVEGGQSRHPSLSDVLPPSYWIFGGHKTMSRSSWPWAPQPRLTSTPNGALDASMRWGVAGDLDELVTLTRALTAGIPEDVAIEPWWSVTDEGCVLTVDHPECRMEAGRLAPAQWPRDTTWPIPLEAAIAMQGKDGAITG